MTDEQPPPMTKPGEKPLDFPSLAVAAELASVLPWRTFPSPAVGTDEFRIDDAQHVTQPVGVVSPVGDHPHRPPSESPGGVDDHRGSERDFRGRCRRQGASHRKTLAVRHHHPLCAFAPLCLADAEPPFFAGAKLPSMKLSSQSSVPRSSSMRMNLRQSLSHTPRSSQSLSRRQQVDALGKCAGRSRHRAPVLSTQKMPSNTSRSGQRGLPILFLFGRTGRICSQNSPVMN